MATIAKIALVGWLGPKKASDYRKLVNLVRDHDAEVRLRAVERIGFNGSRETTDLLLAALDDPDELVRVQGLEELSYRKDLTDADAERIRPCLDDESKLVRRYAATALAAARDLSAIPLLKERLDRAATAEQSSYCFALVELGEREYLDTALGLLEAECYQTRCSVANRIVDFVDDSNREWIVAALRKAWQTEASRAVRTTIERVQKEIG